MSTSTKPTVFVCGATGSQGGALAHQLRDLNWNVHSTVRDLASPAAQSLRDAGVHLTQGDWDDSAALASAMAGCDRLFLCSLPDFADMGREPRQAQGIVNVAKAAGVSQVIASTSLGVFTLEEDPECISTESLMGRHLMNKKGIEQAVREAGFRHWTFLRPSFLMANFLEPKVVRYPEPRDRGTWTTAMTPDAPLALIDHFDIATFAIAVFQHPERYHDRAFGMASEMLSVQGTLDLLGRAAGRSFKALFMTDEEIDEKRKKSDVFVDSQVSMRYMSNYIDMDQIASVIRPTSFRDFLERETELVRKTYS